MKKILAILSIIFITPLTAMATCSSAPIPPVALEQPQLSVDELEIIKTNLETYYMSVSAYRDCINNLIANIAPSDTPAEYFDSPEYQNQFDTYIQLLDIVETQMKAVTNRFNYLTENAN